MTAALHAMPGPVPVTAGAFSLAGLGYTEQEFTLQGTAASYRLTGERTADGRWPAEPAAQAAFTTRLILRRPAADADFSGTVIVEWLNVSGGLEAAPDWMMAHTQMPVSKLVQCSFGLFDLEQRLAGDGPAILQTRRETRGCGFVPDI